MASYPLTEFAQTMSSREIAALTGKDHAHVMRDIRTMLESLGKDQSTFGDIFLDLYEREQPCFKLPFDETTCLLTGYDAKARMAVIKRWRELELASQPTVPQTLSQALRLAADQAEKIEAQTLQIEAQKPAVEFVSRFVEAKSAKGFREVAKILGVPEREFIKGLADDHIIFKQGNNWLPTAYHQQAGRFTVKAGESNGHAFHQTRFTTEGVAWIARRYSDNSK